MKTFKFLLLLYFIPLSLIGQEYEPCGAGYNANAMAGISDCYDDDDFDYTIPVFIHGVKHNAGGAVVTEELASEIVVGLNEMFNNSSSGSHQKITFALAKYDENDQCFPGFRNHQTNISNPVVQAAHDSNIEIIYNTEDKRNRIFNNYLNIFVVQRLIKTAAVQVNIDGYAVFPPSINESDHTYPSVFITQSAYQQKGSALVAHEIGHFFGLYHVFEGNCDASLCTTGDFIESTVPCQQVIGGCNSIINACDPEVPYPSENLMSYSSCRNQFNSEQFDRMGLYIQEYSNLYSFSNLNERIYTGPDPDILSDIAFSTDRSNENLTIGEEVEITISGDVTLTNVNLQMGSGSRIIIPSTSTLRLSNCKVTGNACAKKMWDGIFVSDGGFHCDTRTVISDAFTGLDVKGQSTISIENTTFLNNYYGIKFGGRSSNQYTPTVPLNVEKFTDVEILSTDVLYDYDKLPNIDLSRSNFGIYSDGCSGVFLLNSETERTEITNCKTAIGGYNSQIALNNFTVNNCKYGLNWAAALGVDYNYSAIGLENSIFNDCEDYVLISNARINISSNYFDEGLVGLKLQNIIGQSYVRDNIFYGIYSNAIQIFNSSFIELDLNVVDGAIYKDQYIGNYGLVFKNNELPEFDFMSNRFCTYEENEVLITQFVDEVTGVPFPYTCFIGGGSNNTFSCNNFNRNGVEVEQSPLNTYSCNQFDGEQFDDFGIEANLIFSDISIMSSLVANRFSNSEVGLKLNPGATRIGEQRDHGNLWQNFSSTNLGADAQGVSQLEASRFFVRDVSEENPTSQPSNFFDSNSPNTPETCPGSYNCDGIIGPGLLPPWIGEQFGEDCLDEFFSGNFFSNTSERSKWIILYILIRRYNNGGLDISNLPDCVREIIAFAETSKEKRLISATDIVKRSNVDFNYPEVSAVRGVVSTLLQGGNTESNRNNAILLHAAITTQDYNHHQTYLSDVALLSSEINRMQADNASMSNYIDVLQLYTINVNKSLSPANISTLEGFANMCHNEGNFAKYLAIDLLAQNGIVEDWSSDASCNVDAKDSAPRTSNTVVNEVSIFPNPTSGMIQIESNARCTVIIQNVRGEIVAEGAVMSQLHTFDLDQVSNGVYLISRVTSDGTRTTHKVIKL